MAKKRARKQLNKALAAPSNPVVWMLPLALLVAGGLAYFLTDAFGYDLTWLGSYIWMAVLGLTFLLGLGYFGLYLTPAGWQEEVSLLVTDLWQEVQRLGRPPRMASGRPDLPDSLSLMRAGVLDSHIVLALVRGTTFSRAAGPGYVRLRSGEMVREVLDLRRHSRSQLVNARTRDGIPLQTRITVIFKLREGENGRQSDAYPYPYDEDAVFRASYADSVAEAHAIVPWSERILPEATTAVIYELSRYTLDELHDPAGVISMAEIRVNVTKAMNDMFDDKGIAIEFVRVGQFILDERITRQRIENWQARWQREMDMAEAQSEAAALRELNNVQARAQIDFITKIMSKINESQELDDTDLYETVMLQVLQAMEQAVGEDVRAAHTPVEIMHSLMEFREFLGEPDARGHAPERQDRPEPPALPEGRGEGT